MQKFFSVLAARETRKYLYTLAIAFVPFAVEWGWMTAQGAILVVPLVVAVLNLTPKDVEAVVVSADHIPDEQLGQVTPTATGDPNAVVTPLGSYDGSDPGIDSAPVVNEGELAASGGRHAE